MKMVEMEGGAMHGEKSAFMTMEDVSDKLCESFEDEIEDSKEYLHMAKVAEKHGDEDDAYYLYEMAKDEYTHAMFIHKFMEEHDLHIPEGQKKEYDELSEKIQPLFR